MTEKIVPELDNTFNFVFFFSCFQSLEYTRGVTTSYTCVPSGGGQVQLTPIFTARRMATRYKGTTGKRDRLGISRSRWSGAALNKATIC